MSMVNDILTVHNDTDRVNRTYWKSVQDRRNLHERRWHILLKKTLKKQYDGIPDSITSYESVTIDGRIMEDAITRLYVDVGGDFARREYARHKSVSQYQLMKAEDEWMSFMISYIRGKATDKISSINSYSTVQAKKVIKSTLERSTIEGWGADKTALMIRRSLDELSEISTWRALRIARTEIMTASNVGAIAGARATNLPMQKYWIATYDSRTRDTHREVEGQNPKGMDEKFRVGAYEMDQPGDLDAGPEEVINCRCAIAFETIGI